MFKGELASEVMARFPLTAPAVVGANTTLKVTLWFAVSVAGSVRPVTDRPAPVTFACVMVTEAPPTLVSVSDKLVLVPVVIEPNAKLDEESFSWPGAMPVPESGKLTSPCAPVVVNATLPAKLPVLGGANVTVADVLLPACKVSGSARLLIVNPAPLRVAWLIVRSAVPVLEMVRLLC